MKRHYCINKGPSLGKVAGRFMAGATAVLKAPTMFMVLLWKDGEESLRFLLKMMWTKMFEKPRRKPRGMFCLTAVLRSDRKELCLILNRSLFGSGNIRQRVVCITAQKTPGESPFVGKDLARCLLRQVFFVKLRPYLFRRYVPGWPLLPEIQKFYHPRFYRYWPNLGWLSPRRQPGRHPRQFQPLF